MTKQPALLKSLYQRLDDKALKPGDEFYEPIYAHEGCEDPVALMRQHIEWSNTESIQMFSGFRGSGKTTELFRLQKGLEEKGFLVLYGDALKYLNPAQEIDITDLLIVLAGTFSDALEKAEIGSPGHDSYWERLKNYLVTTKVELGEIGLQAGADLKLNLETSPTFRQLLRQNLPIASVKSNATSTVSSRMASKPFMPSAAKKFRVSSFCSTRWSRFAARFPMNNQSSTAWRGSSPST